MSLPSDVHDIPPLDSKSSVGTGSHTLLNPEISDVRSSVGSSSPGTPTIKFAPLPQTDPTRKRSLAPLGSARSRRKRAIQQEAGPLSWSTDPGLPEDILEDPLITFAKFVKKTGRTLWRRVRKAAISVEDVSYPSEPILDIRSSERGCLSRVEEDKRRRRATWSPSDKRRTLDLDDESERRKSDLSQH